MNLELDQIKILMKYSFHMQLIFLLLHDIIWLSDLIMKRKALRVILDYILFSATWDVVCVKWP